jgi:hypothetical protein
MSYNAKILSQRQMAMVIADLLHTANMADTSEAKDWQQPDDARHLYKVVVDLAGVSRLNVVYTEFVLNDGHHLNLWSDK